MSKLLIHPPATTGSFTLNQGCGKPHEYDGETGIDCGPCADHIATLSPDERVAMHLRGPAPVTGATPEERAAFTQAYLADRERFSWRLVPADEHPKGSNDAGIDDDERAELERLRAEVATHRAGGQKAEDKSPAKRTAAKA